MGATPPRLTDLVLPLDTLLGLADRPGEGHLLGPIDPDLCRKLAAAAIGSTWTRLCVTVTDTAGIAIGHACARPPRGARAAYLDLPGAAAGTCLALPGQVNLTVTVDRLTKLASAAGTGPPVAAWAFTPAAGSGPPCGFGLWTLTLPDGRTLNCVFDLVPTFDCDHRHESHGYQPSARLRHLVQVRDYACTFPTCGRHASDSDWEHAVPYDQGGRTCGCNGGARSRACHQVKQAKGWLVAQPRPGWHEWQTPTGRVYTQEPKRYPT